jgi:hypothetical protein
VVLVIGGVVLSDSRRRNYLSNLTSGGSSFINVQVEKLDPAKRMPSAFTENGKSLVGYSDSSPKFDWNQAAQTEQLSTSKDSDSQSAISSHSNDVPTAAVSFPYVTPDPKDPVAPVQKKNEPVESEVKESRVRQAQKSASARSILNESNKPKPQPPEPELSSPQGEPAPIDSQKIVKNEQQFFQGVFEVIDNCLVFDRPQREAAVITNLPSRTWIRVEKKEGNYLFINSLNDPAVRGYVALEDASFERIGR